MSDLYDLPKDMLVKLVTTIREDTILEKDKELFETVKKLTNNPRKIYCYEKNCDRFIIVTEDDLNIYQNFKDVLGLCDECRAIYCPKHIENIIDTEIFDYCRDCLPKKYKKLTE